MYTRTICIHNNNMCATKSHPTIYPPDRSPPPVVISYTILFVADREMALRRTAVAITLVLAWASYRKYRNILSIVHQR